jgi:hypothetical protein
VYRIHVKPHNKSQETGIEGFVRAENASQAIAKLLQKCPNLTDFGQISINEIPNAVIID